MRSLLAALLLLAGPAFAGEWEQFLDEDGVRGYTRTVAGSKLVEVRSTIVVPARIEVVGAVLRDVEGLARPGQSCTAARYVEKLDRNRYTFYVAYDFPWPASDRDAVIRVVTRYDLDRGRVVADLRAIEDPRVPRQPGHVRITDLASQFVIEYLGRQKTGVIYTSRADPAGHLPAFLVNRGAKKSLKQNALDLRRAAAKPEYLKAAAASPDAALVERAVRDPARMAKIVAYRLGELMRDRPLIARMVGERRVVEALLGEKGNVGELLLHGWGARASQRKAVELLLRQLLAPRIRDRAALARFVTDTARLDRILRGPGADAEVAAFLAGQDKGHAR
jgi:hypothetical protein